MVLAFSCRSVGMYRFLLVSVASSFGSRLNLLNSMESLVPVVSNLLGFND